MLASGCWELGAHTMTHALLGNLSDAERAREIADAKAALATRFGTRIESLAYPFGIYDRTDVDAVAEAGYRYAVTTDPGITTNIPCEPLALKRVKVSGKEGMLGFAIRLRGGKRGLFE